MPHINKGFIYMWALFSVAIVGIVLAGIGQVWQTKAQREKERELLFVGDQFRKAIMSYYNNATGGLQQYPESLEDLLIDTRSPTPKRHLRKIFLDPMTNSYEWGAVTEPVSEQETSSGFLSNDAGIIGVYSRSKKVPAKIKNFPEDYSSFSKADSYQDWKFIFYPKNATGQSTSSQSNPPVSGTSSTTRKSGKN
jgi:type II secretory pathway pseudopilin PulG